jgi:hypothetical protein
MITTMSRTATTDERPVVLTMYVGLVLTVVAAIVPLVDHATGNVLAEHIRAGYPDISQSDLDVAVTTYLVYLSVLGLLGAICWISVIWAVKSSKRWARLVATTLFVLGTVIALTDLLIEDTSGDTGLPALLGWVGMLPCLAGFIGVALLWKRSYSAMARDPWA